MKNIILRLPLRAKLLLIVIVPVIFIVYLTFQIHKEKKSNILQIESYMENIDRSVAMTMLSDLLQAERRASFDYVLLNDGQARMYADRSKTDSALQLLESRHGNTLKDFEKYIFLESIDSARSRIDRQRSNANSVMHFYSNAVFRISTLNNTPSYSNIMLDEAQNELGAQKLLSEMITYLGIVNANVSNVLHTKAYVIETLMGTLGTYDTYLSYKKEFLQKADSSTARDFRLIQQSPKFQPMENYLHNLFTTFKLDSSYTYSQWNEISDAAIGALRTMQMNLVTRATEKIDNFYNDEQESMTINIVMLIITSVLLLGITSYILLLINGSLDQLKVAALKIADGETDIEVIKGPDDAIGSLANSIRQIDAKNRELASAAREIGLGNFDTALSPRSAKDHLGSSILQMKDQISVSTGELKKSREEFRQLADLMPQIVWTSRVDGHIDYYNKRWTEITGIENDQGERSWLAVIHPQDAGTTLSAWYRSIEDGTVFEQEYRIKDKKSQTYRWFLARALPFRDQDDHIIRWFGTATDIHDQKLQHERLEEIIEERTLELTRSNEDLQQFAHVASHDLKEPFRKIRTFCDKLDREFRDILPEKGRLYIDKLQVSAERMSNMIDAVLSYSMVNASGNENEPIDLNRVIADISNDLELLIMNKEANIASTELPTISGAPVLIYQLFYNLISNSLKFSRSDVHPEIRIAATEKTAASVMPFPGKRKDVSYYEFQFSDNGIGFNQEYSGKMFNVFTRLNSRESYEGTGLGLALCKRIVHRHHGHIIAEGTEGVGAVFTVYLPA